MRFDFKNQYPNLTKVWEKYLPHVEKVEVPAKTILLNEGELSQKYISIDKGCLRAYFNHDGTDKTVQFFFENERLASLDSFINNTPSLFSIETIEASQLSIVPKKYALQLLDELSNEPGFVKLVLQMTSQRQTHYMQEFVSAIRDTPEQRYQNLLTHQPHVIQRIPQHYIASYLGVSTVHLSRIKSKLAKGRLHF